jgi:hypothetical protein
MTAGINGSTPTTSNIRKGKKNLLDNAAVKNIIARVMQLQPYQKAIWGEMNATEMLLHCNLCNTQILSGDMPYQPTGFKQLLLRILALYIAPDFKKNVASAPRNHTKGIIKQNEFENQRIQFIAIMHEFARRTTPIILTHPAFGNLNTNQWGIAAWKHMDHHLRQFGV